MSRILVIDDDEMMRGVLHEIFTQHGYEVALACDGREGVDLYRQTPCDLVLTDVFMPEKDGVEVLLELRAEFPGAKIVAISGGGKVAGTSVLDTLTDLGVSATFEKPFRPKDLLEAVEEILAGA